MTNKIFSRKSLLPLVAGVLIGATVGGVGIVVAVATTNTVTGCANKTTGILRYSADGKCKSKIENKMFLTLKHYSKLQKKNQMMKRRRKKLDQHNNDESGYPSPQKNQNQ